MNRERNKAFIIGLVGILFVLTFECVFLYFWGTQINILKENPFENKGNWLIALVYFIELILLMKVYGASQ